MSDKFSEFSEKYLTNIPNGCIIYMSNGTSNKSNRKKSMENKMKKTIRELRRMTGLHQAEFGKRLGGIPLRTIQNWENGLRTPPQWAVELIAFRVEHDNYLLTEEEMLYRKAQFEEFKATWNAFQNFKKNHPRKKKTDEKMQLQEERIVIEEKNNQSVVLYARESKHAGAEESLERQKEKLRAFCEQSGHDIFAEIAAVENRQDSMHYLKLAIELAKNTEGKTLLMASSDRVAGTHEEITKVTDLIESAGVTIVTMDGSYEHIQKYGVSFESLIASTLSATDEETDDE